MAVFRINKTEDYTVMSNQHLYDKQLSLKAKGLLSLMLSLPEEWDYSTKGLMTLTADGKDSVQKGLQELEMYGYLERTKMTDEKGRFTGFLYDIYEKPHTENPCPGNPSTVFPSAENPPQLNTKQLNTKEINNCGCNSASAPVREEKHKYGQFKNVLLTEREYDKLILERENGKEAIEYLSDYREMKGYKAKSDYRAICNWVFKALREEQIREKELKQREARLAEQSKRVQEKAQQSSSASPFAELKKRLQAERENSEVK